MNEKAIGIAAKLYQARSSLRNLFPDTWPKPVEKHISAIKAISNSNKSSILDAARVCISFSIAENDPINATKFMAACVEIVEPSNAKISGPADKNPSEAEPTIVAGSTASPCSTAFSVAEGTP